MSTVTLETKNQAWYHRYEKVVQWITLCMIVIGGILHYFFVDHPAIQAQEESRRLTQQLIEESKKNQQLLDQKLVEAQANTEALRTNLEQVKVQIQLWEATVEQIQDPIRKASDNLLLKRQQLERVKVVDELVDSLVPNLQVKFKPKVTWFERFVSFAFEITNAGKRAIRVAQPQISLTANPAQSSRASIPMPKSSDMRVSVCSAGFISPGETINCAVILRTEVSLSTVGSISYRASFSAHTDLPENSETAKMVRSAYNEPYLETRMTKNISFNGEIWR